MVIFVITKNYQQYKDFLRIWKLNSRYFIYLNDPQKALGHHRFLFIEYGQLPDNYHELLTHLILPYEAIKVTLKEARDDR